MKTRPRIALAHIAPGRIITILFSIEPIRKKLALLRRSMKNIGGLASKYAALFGLRSPQISPVLHLITFNYTGTISNNGIVCHRKLGKLREISLVDWQFAVFNSSTVWYRFDQEISGNLTNAQLVKKKRNGDGHQKKSQEIHLN